MSERLHQETEYKLLVVVKEKTTVNYAKGKLRSAANMRARIWVYLVHVFENYFLIIVLDNKKTQF